MENSYGTGTYRVGDADRMKLQWRALGEQMEDEMIAESYKCDGRRVVVSLEKDGTAGVEFWPRTFYERRL
jgi:hypothetical protein